MQIFKCFFVKMQSILNIVVRFLPIEITIYNLKKMLKHLIYFLILFDQTNWAQINYPKDYFQKPLDIPLFLSGNFGELRDNHFHSGLDYKTQQKEGFNVNSIADGYISRIKIDQYGYGKAIYITHPNGYTSVYGHLKNFEPQLEQYIKKIQYEKQDFEIEVFPKPNELPLKKGEFFAYSGNTGSSGGPHLHFEIRETDSQKVVNPSLFGLGVDDHRKPKVLYLFAYPLDENSAINQLYQPIQINIKTYKELPDSLVADTVFAFGKIGFAVNTYDQQDYDDNQNGIYSLKMLVNGNIKYHHQLDKFSFDESKQINLHIDYEYYEKNNIRLQKCFVEPQNKLSTYFKSFSEKGYINVKENDTLQVQIIVGDIEGNETFIKIPVIGKKLSLAMPKKVKKTNCDIVASEAKSIKLKNSKIYFPSNTYYANTGLNIYENEDGSVQVHEDIIPINRNFSITFDVSSLDAESKKHSYVAKVGKNGYLTYISSSLKENQLTGKARTLGKYIVKQDFKAPTIKPINFSENKWITEEKSLKVKIDDDLSGIKNYTASINGKWILMERNHNTNILTFDFNDLTFEGTEYNFEISVTDNAHNTKTYKTTFYRAKDENNTEK